MNKEQLKNKCNIANIQEKTSEFLGIETKIDYIVDNDGNYILAVSPLEYKIIEMSLNSNKRLDDPLCDIYPSCGNSLEELLASIIIKEENPPEIPRLDNIEAKINEIIDWANNEGANIDNLE